MLAYTSCVYTYAQVVCPRTEILASGCAVSRAFPIYIRKTCGQEKQTIAVGFIPVGDNSTSVTDEEVKCLSALSEGIRLAQEIVDAPPNEMHTDSFLDVSDQAYR